MTDHIRVTFTPGPPKTNVLVLGSPGPLPAIWLPFWKGNPLDVRDLGPRGQPGEGYWLYTKVTESIADKENETHALVERVVDVNAMTVTDTLAKRNKTLVELRPIMIAKITAKKEQALAAGVAYADKRIATDDGSRADITGMAATAMAVLVGLPGVTWPASYALGWIAMDNTRIALPEPADGIALAAAVGMTYSVIVQNARTLKDKALAAASAAALSGIDIGAGWPE